MRARGLIAICLVAVACTTTASDGPTTTPDSEASEVTDTGSASGSALTCWSAPTEPDDGDLLLTDVTEETGLITPLTGMHGHAAIWTDVNGDEIPDLYVGSFADRPEEIYQHRGADGPSPDRLLIGDGSGFTVADLDEMRTRTSGGVPADLDGDGDLDLVVSRNIKDADLGQSPTLVLENSDGRLAPVTENGLPVEFGGRSVGVLDYDSDGLHDLFMVEDRFTGGSSRLLHNLGDFEFEDVTAGNGIPADVHGLGVAVADFDGSGGADIFVSGSNRIFYSDGNGGFTEGDSTVFEWELFGNEDDVAGVSVADVNRDGLLDIAIGQHFNSTLDQGTRVSVRLYLNQGDRTFRDVTETAGLSPLPTKAPHVELIDMNNDGWPDLVTSASADGGPAIFIHQGLQDGVPVFLEPSGLGDAQYWVAAPTSDYDGDGRRDIFLMEWEPSLPSLLLRNETSGGHWLGVSVDATKGFGINWIVEVYDGDELLAARSISPTEGYSAGVLPTAHFGLGDVEEVTVRMIPPNGAEPFVVEGLTVDQHIRWPNGCS